MAVSPSIHAGEPIPGYRLIERLGRGGYGEVWKCEAPGGIMKAIKFVYGDIEGACSDDKSAEQELKALNRVKTIRHPFVLSLERFDIVQGQLLIVMELADRNLWDRYTECRKQGLVGVPRDELLGYMDETAEALDLMNEQYQLQHLDIKPQNLFLVYNHIKVADFGLAKDLQGIRATMTGGVTPLYAAPETFEGWVSRFCDQYSLAIVYQEMLTGERPFAGTNIRHLTMQHLSAVPNVSSLPEAERPIIARALSKTPDERFPHCRDMVIALRNAARAAAEPKVVAVAVGERTRSETPPPTPAVPETEGSGAKTLKPPKASTHRSMPRLTTPGGRGTERGTEEGSPALLTPPMPSTMDSKPRTLAEKRGEGLLYPTLVIGLGGMGAQALRAFRRHVAERYPGEAPPNLQYLYLDTDGHDIAAETSPAAELPLAPNEVYHLSLHRPAHYLKQGHLPPVEAWHDPELLYKIPREGGTQGMRAIGRLALLDHAAGVRGRLAAVLRKFRQDGENLEFGYWKGLGLRSSFPRVAIVSSLTGGTGGGTAVDVAYLVRRELQRYGFDPGRISGYFFLPEGVWKGGAQGPLDRPTAALRELDGFMAGREIFRAHYSLKEDAVADPNRPFESAALIPLEKPSVKNPQVRHLELVSESLFHEGFTGLGRKRDELEGRRREREFVPPYRNLALVRLVWPRRKLLGACVGKLAERLLRGWTEGDGGDQGDPAAFTLEFLGKKRLDADSLRKQIEDSLRRKSGESVAERTAAVAARLVGLRESPTAAEACAIIEPLVDTVGAPANAADGPMAKLHGELFKELARETETRLSEIAVNLVEMPGKRFAFTLRVLKAIDEYLSATIEEIQKALRANDRDCEARYEKVLSCIGNLENSVPKLAVRRADPRAELAELIGGYAARRMEGHREYALQCVLQSWRGILPEFTRDINFCRTQVRELFEVPIRAARQANRPRALEYHVLPGRAREMDEAGDELLKGITAADWAALDERLQVRIRRECSALVRVCLQKDRYRDRFLALLGDELKSLADTRLPSLSSVEMFLEGGRDPQVRHRDIQRAFDDMGLTLLSGKSVDGAGANLHLLGLPESEGRAEFETLLGDILSDAAWQDFATAHEVVLACEQRFAAGAHVFGTGERAAPALGPGDRYLFSRTDYAWFPDSADPAVPVEEECELFADSLS